MTRLPLTMALAMALSLSGLALLSGALRAETGRYTMTPTPDGVLKLDTRTGAVSLCKRSQGAWSCASVDNNESELLARIERLERENERLRARLREARKRPLPPLAEGKKEGGKLELPSEEDVDKAMDFVERLLKRFKGMVEDLKKNNKEDEDGVPL
jgi:hypothetical protein